MLVRANIRASVNHLRHGSNVLERLSGDGLHYAAKMERWERWSAGVVETG